MSSKITDEEVLAFIARTEACYPADTVTFDLEAQRRIYDEMCGRFRAPRPAGVAVTDERMDGPGGPLALRRYRTPGAGALALYFHGGGFVVGGLDSHDDVCAEIAAAADVDVLAVDYRLAPEHRHPAAYQDCLAVLDRFADAQPMVIGDSGGGNLAAAVALARRDEVRAQVLIYPGLGGEALSLPSYAERAEAPMLTTRDVHSYMRLRAGGRAPVDDLSFSPLLAKDLTGMPPCFASAAEHDPLRDDAAEWVRRLEAVGVAAACSIEAELPHGHLRARHSSARASAAFDRIVEAVRGFSAGQP